MVMTHRRMDIGPVRAEQNGLRIEMMETYVGRADSHKWCIKASVQKLQLPVSTSNNARTSCWQHTEELQIKSPQDAL